MSRALVTLVLGCIGAIAVWAEPQPIPEEFAVAVARRLCEKADKDEGAPLKITGDPEKAHGLHEPEVAAAMVVPRTELKMDNLKNVDQPKGEPTGYLFLYKITLLLDNKPYPQEKLPTVVLKSDDGVERTVIALRLALRKDAEDDWKLLVFGKENKPLVTAKFRQEPNNSSLPLSLSAKDIGENQGTLVVTVFGKYAADVRLAKAD